MRGGGKEEENVFSGIALLKNSFLLSISTCEMLKVMMGPTFNMLIFVLCMAIARLSQRFLTRFPDTGSRFLVCMGIACIFGKTFVESFYLLLHVELVYCYLIP